MILTFSILYYTLYHHVLISLQKYATSIKDHPLNRPGCIQCVSTRTLGQFCSPPAPNQFILGSDPPKWAPPFVDVQLPLNWGARYLYGLQLVQASKLEEECLSRI